MLKRLRKADSAHRGARCDARRQVGILGRCDDPRQSEGKRQRRGLRSRATKKCSENTQTMRMNIEAHCVECKERTKAGRCADDNRVAESQTLQAVTCDVAGSGRLGASVDSRVAPPDPKQAGLCPDLP